MSWHRWRFPVLSVLAAAPFCSLGAQPPTRPIGRAEVEYLEPFTTISGLVELRDGRVIVADSRDKTLQLIDLSRGTATPVGRAGSGPAEWANPGRMFAIPGDTTLMLDVANGRFFVVHPDGKPGATRPIDAIGPLSFGEFLGVDPAGRVIILSDRRPARPGDGTVGIADLLRYERHSGRVDTLATLAQPKGEKSAAQVLPNGMLRMATNLPLAAQDLAAVGADGRVAIIRAAPYRIEWITPDGRRVVGPDAEAPAIRVTDAEKEAFVRGQVRPGGILLVGPSGAPPQRQGRAAAPKLTSADFKRMMDPDMTWPAVKPPFMRGALHVAPDGRAWVHRSRAHDDSIAVFDVFDRSGRVVERVALPPQTRLVGFGRGSVYLARTDEDDLVWLQRVRLSARP